MDEDCKPQPLTDKKQLLQFGYKAHHIIEYPDGSATLDYEVLNLERELRRMLPQPPSSSEP